MISTPETRAHAQDILDYIAAHPEEHSQADWVRGGFVPSDATPETGCGTTMCIAGTSIFLKQGPNVLNNPQEYYSELGRKNLGLTYEEKEILFFLVTDDVALRATEAIAAGSEDALHEVLKPYDYADEPVLGG